MAKPTPARRVAWTLLSLCRRRGARMRDLLRGAPEMAELDERDRSLATRLCLGVTGTWGLLDELLDAHVRRPSSLEPRVRDALRLSCYELCFLDTPATAAVSQGVELVRLAAPRAAGMANAVLRRVVEEDAARVREAAAQAEEGLAGLDVLALASGLPRWLLGEVAASRGAEAARALALAQRAPAPVYGAINLARHDAEEGMAILTGHGLGPRREEPLASFVLEQPRGLAQSGLVSDADVVVADLAAQRVAACVGVRPGMRVLEVGQGRGTKSVLLQNHAIAAGGWASVVGVDSEGFKVREATRRMAAAGLAEHVRCVCLDGRNLGSHEASELVGDAFDLVFVDAPCSGTGTMRRHPEIAWSLCEGSLAGDGSLPALQLDLLCAASRCVGRDGVLAYATCSVLRQENEAVVEAFLATDGGQGFRVVPQADGQRFLQEIPQPGGDDGHFCCVMRRDLREG